MAIELDSWTDLQAMGSGTPPSWTLAEDYLLKSDLLKTDGDYTGTGDSFSPIGTIVNPFTGTFDGENHTIEGLTVDYSAQSRSAGLFGEAAPCSTFKDLVLTEVDITGSSTADPTWATGAFIGYPSNEIGGTADISGITLLSGTVDGARYVGGLFGYMSKIAGSISDCHVSEDVTVGDSADLWVGGIAGQMQLKGGTALSVSNCHSAVSCGSTSANRVGSFTGSLVSTGAGSTAQMSSCYATGNVCAAQSVGGFTGWGGGGWVLRNCYATGNVTASDGRAGGFVGWCEDAAQTMAFRACFALGNVTNDANETGGFCGGIRDGSYSFSNCFARGDVECTAADKDRVGGFIGMFHPEAGLTGGVRHCYSTGKVTTAKTSADEGGFIGLDDNGSIVVTDCFWDTQTSGLSTDGTASGSTGRTTVQMQYVGTYTDESGPVSSAWDFLGNPFDDLENLDYWDISPGINDGYPYLLGIGAGPMPLTFSNRGPSHDWGWNKITA